MGNYKVTTASKTVNVMCEGVFTPSDAQAFVEDFKKEVAKVNPSESVLNLDATKLAVSAAEMHDILKGCLELYKALGFNQVTLSVGDNVIVKMQIQRLAKEIGFSSIEMK